LPLPSNATIGRNILTRLQRLNAEAGALWLDVDHWINGGGAPMTVADPALAAVKPQPGKPQQTKRRRRNRGQPASAAAKS
jgi:hypothetical protein